MASPTPEYLASLDLSRLKMNESDINPWFSALSPDQVETIKREHDTAEAFRHIWEGSWPPEMMTESAPCPVPREVFGTVTLGGEMYFTVDKSDAPDRIVHLRVGQWSWLPSVPRKSKGYRRHVRRRKAAK